MSRILEFIGPRGVGKTTIYKALIKKWSRSCNWAPQSHFLTTNKSIRSGILSCPEILLRKLFNTPAYDKKTLKNAGYLFQKDYPEFVTFCWELINKNQSVDYNGVDNRFRVANNLYSYFKIFHAINNSTNLRICVSDELIVQRIVQLTNELGSLEEIQKFTKLVPIPEALIYLDAPSKDIAKRNQYRGFSLIHKARSFKTLLKRASTESEKYKILTKLLSERGTAVLSIDTTNDIRKNVDIIIGFIANEL